MPVQSLPPLLCPACHEAIDQLPHCSHCGADLQAWRRWTKANWSKQFSQFWLYTPWGWLTFISLLLPSFAWWTLNSDFVTFETFIFATASYVSLIVLCFIYFKRDQLWLTELTRQTVPASRPGLLTLGGSGFIFFIIVSFGSLIVGSRILADGNPIVAPSWDVTFLLGVTFIIQAFSASIYTLYAYGIWLLKNFPAPIFLNTAYLLKIAEREAVSHLQAQASQQELLHSQISEVKQSQQAGLTFRFQVEFPSLQAENNRFLRSRQVWLIETDPWGKLLVCQPDGAPEYVENESSVQESLHSSSYSPKKTTLNLESPTNQAPPPLEGDIIFPDG